MEGQEKLIDKRLSEKKTATGHRVPRVVAGMNAPAAKSRSNIKTFVPPEYSMLPAVNERSVRELKNSIYRKDSDEFASGSWEWMALFAVISSATDRLNDLLYDILSLRDDACSSECLDHMEVLDMVGRRRAFSMERRELGMLHDVRDKVSGKTELTLPGLMTAAIMLADRAEKGSGYEEYLESVISYMNNAELAETCFDLCVSAMKSAGNRETQESIAHRTSELATTPRRMLKLRVATAVNTDLDAGSLDNPLGIKGYEGLFDSLDGRPADMENTLMDWMCGHRELRGTCLVGIAEIVLSEMPANEHQRSSYISKIIEATRVFEDTAECYRVSTGGL